MNENSYKVYFHEHRWIVNDPFKKKNLASCDRKDCAIDFAKNTARRHRPSKVTIYLNNGNFDDEYNFGLKPYPGEG